VISHGPPLVPSRKRIDGGASTANSRGMIGVGAAFDYHAGTIKRAPSGCKITGSNGYIEWPRSPPDSTGAIRKPIRFFCSRRCVSWRVTPVHELAVRLARAIGLWKRCMRPITSVRCSRARASRGIPQRFAPPPTPGETFRAPPARFLFPSFYATESRSTV
jgi:hypothetical protein